MAGRQQPLRGGQPEGAEFGVSGGLVDTSVSVETTPRVPHSVDVVLSSGGGQPVRSLALLRRGRGPGGGGGFPHPEPGHMRCPPSAPGWVRPWCPRTLFLPGFSGFTPTPPSLLVAPQNEVGERTKQSHFPFWKRANGG